MGYGELLRKNLRIVVDTLNQSLRQGDSFLVTESHRHFKSCPAMAVMDEN